MATGHAAPHRSVVRARQGPLPADAPEHPCAQPGPGSQWAQGVLAVHGRAGRVDDWPLRLAPPAACSWAMPWGGGSQQVASEQAGAVLRLGRPGQGLGKTLGVPWVGEAGRTHGRFLLVWKPQRLRASSPFCRAGRGQPSSPMPRPQTCCVPSGVAVSLPHSLPSSRVQRGCALLDAGGVGLTKRGAGLGFTQAQTCLHHRVLGPRQVRGDVGPQALPLDTGDLKGPVCKPL